MKLDSLADVEGPHQAILRAFPFLGHPTAGLALAAGEDQRVIDVDECFNAGTVGAYGGINHRRAGLGDTDNLIAGSRSGRGLRTA
ncbi:hypothetical protein SDC9_82362 [bioreactor metagenome]|uniref:Uncharacterized protein n=1 Tax=bioreactor metagenome TaxID=1076179 RepID=A0A644Z660_9ZZZZ